ncbi:Thioredoxin-like fold [Pseudocohnilembus persalinus]|uniref:Thioredoxin-like fold n=1 Tax=Pseudocohnilembus persalinus TaxID=266149 RepID=A0A0V0R8G9_PSEPJ|nr:Thioredoxin-like fold [Pseudocohnilembus persalinus]|eukprot:KRX10602.1 Thioredoxin-like fold [Pseudocohnilembus persalinus]
MEGEQREITYKEWEQEYDNKIKSAENYVVIFSGSKDAQGVNWCSDCVEVADSMKQIQKNAQEQNIPCVLVRAGLRDEWRDPENILRTHKYTKITGGIPTVILYQKGSIARKMEYKELQIEGIVQEFLEDL